MFKFNLKLQREIASEDPTASPILRELTDEEKNKLFKNSAIDRISIGGFRLEKTDFGLKLKVEGEIEYHGKGKEA
jgi:hypothetical protein